MTRDHPYFKPPFTRREIQVGRYVANAIWFACGFVVAWFLWGPRLIGGDA